MKTHLYTPVDATVKIMTEETAFQVEVVNNDRINNGKTDGINNIVPSRPTRLAILGSGNYGRALAGRLYHAGVESCVVGSRHPTNSTCEGLKIVTYEEAITDSDIIFLCIPAHAYENTIAPLTTLLVGKIVIEISNLENENDSSNALRLQELIPLTHVIKALNTVSAYTIGHDTYGASRDTYICGESDDKKVQLMQVLREIGLNPLDRGRLRSAVMVEKLPFRFFPGWRTAIAIAIMTLIPILFYTYLRYFWYQEKSKRTDEDLALYIANRTIGWLMFWLLSMTYLPGILAGFIQICAGTKYKRFPIWLDRWMKSRKQLGLICLLLASIHGCMSCLLIGSGEVKHMLQITSITLPGKKPIILYQNLDTYGQVSLLFATLALALMAILGITSLPSVNRRMSWKEWDFVQRGLGFTSLIFGFLHVMIYIYYFWDPTFKGWKTLAKNSKGVFPPSAFVMPMFPLIVICLKFILMLPGLSCYLNKIRNGKVGYKHSKKISAA